MNTDLRNATYDEIVAFVFDHWPEDEVDAKWYWQLESDVLIYCCGNCHPATDAEDARVQDTMFEALTSMLVSDHPETIRAALHGLGHLEHRDGNRAIRELLSSSRPIPADVRTYAAKVLEGRFQ